MASLDSSKNCSMTFHFGESGQYVFETKFKVSDHADVSCALVVIVKPVNSNLREYSILNSLSLDYSLNSSNIENVNIP